MADFISVHSYKLNANATGLVGGLNVAALRMRQFQSQSQSFAVNVARNVGSGIATAARSIASLDFGSMVASLGSLATGPIGMTIAAIAAATVGMVDFAMHSMDAVAVQQRLGLQLGVTAQEAAGLLILGRRFDVDAAAMNEATSKWAMRLGELRSEIESGRGGEISAALGEMGINAAEFIAMRLPEQFAMIAEAAKRIEDPLRRQDMVMKVLGRRVAALAPMFTDFTNDVTGDEFRNVAGVAAGAGYSISQEEAETIEGAMNALELKGAYVRAVFSNIGQGAAVALALPLTHVMETLEELATKGQPLLKAMGGAIVLAMMPINWIITAISVGIQASMPVIVALGNILTNVGRRIMQTWELLAPVFKAVGQAFMALLGNRQPIQDFADWLEKFGGEFAENIVKGFGFAILYIVDLVVGALAEFAEISARAGQSANAFFRSAAGLYGLVSDDMQFNTDELTAFAREMRAVQRLTADAAKNLNNPLTATVNAPPEQTIGAGWVMNERGLMMLAENEARGFTNTIEGWFDVMTELHSNPIYWSPPQMMDGWSSAAEKIEKANRRIGLSREDLELMDAREQANDRLSAAAEARIRAAQAERTLLEQQLELEKQRLQVLQQNRSPLHRFEEAMTNIEQMGLAAGTVAGDAAIGRAFEELERSLPQIQDRIPQALLFGSVQEQAAIQATRREARRDRQDPQERIRQTLERALQFQQETRDSNRRIAAAVENIRFDVLGR